MRRRYTTPIDIVNRTCYSMLRCFTRRIRGLPRDGDSLARGNTLSQKENMQKLPNGISDGKWVLGLELRSSILPHPEDKRTLLSKRPCVIERIEGAYLMGITREEV